MKDLQYGYQSETECNKNIKEKTTVGLLEFLQAQIGCLYLSDLHIPCNLHLIQIALRKTDPENYDISEWNDAVCYITGQDLKFENQSDAAKYLMNQKN